MAVVQISRIQVRRGKENSGSGLPQLASGEMAWSVDAQNLWIGNGSVAEGAPNIGNTKILTANDLGANGNILDLINFQYKKNDYSIITSRLGVNYPTIRAMQDRLDDEVNVFDFGAKGDGVTDDTVALQLAINELFLNPINITNPASRKTLFFPPGKYIVTATLYVPSYATLTGYGIGKTVIQYNNTASTPGPVMQFVNDTATPGVPNIFSMPLVERPTYNPNGSSGTTLKLTRTDALAGTTGISVGMVITGTGFSGSQIVTAIIDSQTVTLNIAPNGTPSGVLTFTATQAPAPTYISQPKYIQVSDLSLYTNTSDQAGLQLDAVRDSRFENIEITGAWAYLSNEYSRGIYLTAFSRLVTCQRNLFKNIQISSFTYGVLSNNDIYNNAFTDLHVTDTRQGVALGKTSNRTSVGQQYGPCNTTFSDSIFENIKQHAIYIYLGSGNTTRNTRLINVGNDGGSNTTSARYPQIYFASAGNSSQYDQSDRGDDLAIVTPSVNTTYTALGSTGTILNVASTTGISIGMSIDGTGFNSALTPYRWIVQSISSNVQVIISAAPNGTPSGVLTFSVPYYPEISGLVSYDSHSTRQVNITNTATPTFGFRLPLPTDGVNYVINYLYRSKTIAVSRRGTITIMCDVVNNAVQLTDEYDYVGSLAYDVNLAFTARIITNSLEVDYTNTTSPDDAILIYSYSAVL
jgi:hypothetical protein